MQHIPFFFSSHVFSIRIFPFAMIKTFLLPFLCFVHHCVQKPMKPSMKLSEIKLNPLRLHGNHWIDGHFFQQSYFSTSWPWLRLKFFHFVHSFLHFMFRCIKTIWNVIRDCSSAFKSLWISYYITLHFFLLILKCNFQFYFKSYNQYSDRWNSNFQNMFSLTTWR